jgi:tetratricopeptide (TPR) repeat protein
VTRKFFLFAASLVVLQTQSFAQVKQRPEPKVEVQEPPEEDVGSLPKEYAFNPLQATKDLQIGNYYFKKGSYKAAAKRFEEATKWNPGYADAYLRLAEAKHKLNDKPAEIQAYKKYLEIEPDGKDAAAVRKKVGSK